MKRQTVLILAIILLTATLAGCTSQIQRMFRKVDSTAENTQKPRYR